MKNIGLFIVFAMFSVSCNSQNGIEVLSQKEFKEKMNEVEGYYLIDVRTPEEIAEGKIDNALEINVNSSNFQEEIEKLDKDKAVFIYCRSGRRSARAANLIKEMGFEEIYDLKGGILAWE